MDRTIYTLRLYVGHAPCSRAILCLTHHGIACRQGSEGCKRFAPWGVLSARAKARRPVEHLALPYVARPLHRGSPFCDPVDLNALSSSPYDDEQPLRRYSSMMDIASFLQEFLLIIQECCALFLGRVASDTSRCVTHLAGWFCPVPVPVQPGVGTAPPCFVTPVLSPASPLCLAPAAALAAETLPPRF